MRVEVRDGGGPDAACGGAGGTVVAALVGEITSDSAPALRERLPRLVPDGGRLCLDLSQVSYVSSAGLRVLVLLHREARGRRAEVVLAGLGEQLRFVLAATGFLDLLVLEPEPRAGDGARAGHGAAPGAAAPDGPALAGAPGLGEVA